MKDLTTALNAVPDLRVKKALLAILDAIQTEITGNNTDITALQGDDDTLAAKVATSVLNTGGLALKAGASPLAKTVNTIYVAVGNAIISKAAGDMAALSGTVTNAAFNIFAFTIDSAGDLTTTMGTEGASLATVVFPTIPSGEACIGFVIVNPTGTGDFVGGTTALDDGTVVPNAVYVNTPFPFDPNLVV